MRSETFRTSRRRTPQRAHTRHSEKDIVVLTGLNVLAAFGGDCAVLHWFALGLTPPRIAYHYFGCWQFGSKPVPYGGSELFYCRAEFER